MNDIINECIIALLAFLGGAGWIFFWGLKKHTGNGEKSVNEAPAGRKTQPGQVDEKGWKQELQAIGDPGKGSLPEGVKAKDIETRVDIDIKIDADPKHEQPTRTLINKLKTKYLVLALIFLTSQCMSQTIPVEKADFLEMVKSLEKLATIEESKPLFVLSPIELLYDSDGRIYSKPELSGTMIIGPLNYALKADLNIKAVHRRKHQQGRLFSLSVLYTGDNLFLLETKKIWGVAATFELWTIRPLIYGTLESYGIGARLPIYGNAGMLIGADYPGWNPRFGVLFRL